VGGLTFSKDTVAGGRSGNGGAVAPASSRGFGGTGTPPGTDGTNGTPGTPGRLGTHGGHFAPTLYAKGGQVSVVAIVTAKLMSATKGHSYHLALAAQGGKTPYHWSKSSGTLPKGLTVSSTGVIAGKPASAGTFSFIVAVTDSKSSPSSDTRSYSLVVKP
jgi:hypothetical protein